MSRILHIIAASLLAVSSANAQCYEVVQMPFYPFPMTNGTQLTLSDDILSGTIDIGFDFCFFGQTHTQVLIASNGYITFNVAGAQPGGYSPFNVSAPVPNAVEPSLLSSIMSPWQDINPGAGGQISYATFGMAPYRKFVVSYADVPMFSCTNMLFNNQIVLYETLNIIDINIANKPNCPGWNNGSAIEGIQNADGTEAYVVPGRNYPDMWESTGDSYRFIPQCYCAPPAGLLAGDVAGQVYWDYDQDCVNDPGEPGIANVRFDLQPGNGVVWSGQQGNINFMAEPGTFTMEHSAQNPFWLQNICPAAPVSVTVVNGQTTGPLLWADTIIPFQDVAVNIGSGWLAACFPTSQFVQVCNNGNVPAQNVVVSVLMPPMVEAQSLSLPATMAGDTLTWSFPWMDAGQCFSITLSDSVICDAALVDQLACFNAWVAFEGTDVDLSNDADHYCGTIHASFDPNAIEVRVADVPTAAFAPNHFITAQDELEYVIHFQNTGNGPAYNVSVVQQLPEWLNGQTIVPGASNHAYTAHYLNGVLQFDFAAIMLIDSASDPQGSQGWVRYTIAQTDGNQMGTTIPAQANIYFDNNAAVATNVTESVIALVTDQPQFALTSPTIVPNPATNALRVVGVTGLSSLNIVDMSGRVLRAQANYSGQSIDLSGLPAGVYMLNLRNNTQTWSGRLVVLN